MRRTQDSEAAPGPVAVPVGLGSRVKAAQVAQLAAQAASQAAVPTERIQRNAPSSAPKSVHRRLELSAGEGNLGNNLKSDDDDDDDDEEDEDDEEGQGPPGQGQLALRDADEGEWECPELTDADLALVATGPGGSSGSSRTGRMANLLTELLQVLVCVFCRSKSDKACSLLCGCL